MHPNNFIDRYIVDSSNVHTFTDKLHGDPFKNLTIWVRSLDPTITFSYTVDYGGAIKAGPTSVAAGKTGNYSDTQIQPYNQPNSNWAARESSGGDGFAVGVPINVAVTNTGAVSAVFLVSFVSESYGQIVG
jgi:hypothetical protein